MTNKYGAVAVTVDGRRYSSKAEAAAAGLDVTSSQRRTEQAELVAL